MRAPSLRSRLERLVSRAAPPGTAPGWAHELAGLLEGAERVGARATRVWNRSPAEAALAPLLASAEAALEAELTRSGAAVLASARRELVGLLSRRLVTVCVRVLDVEQRAHEATAAMLGTRAAPLAPRPTEWMGRFERYPVLAWLLGRTLQGWRAHVRELVQRCEADRALLTASLFEGRPAGALAGVVGDAGDVHDDGRSVTVLCFEDGRRAVYKPKDLRITRAVMALCAFLNEAGLPVPLHVRAVLAREGYTWEEFVPAAPCRTSAEVERFAVRVGMLARLMQLLEATDLWVDNLVAAGEHPVLIDLEMVLQPRLPEPPGRSAERQAEAWLRESVAPLGLLAAPMPIVPGVEAEDMGALACARTFLTPHRSEPRLEVLAGEVRASREGFLLWSHAEHVPTLAGEPVRLTEYLEPLREGYRAMHAVLRRQREVLLTEGGPLARMAGLPVRYIHRTTWTSYRLLKAGLAPRFLVDGAKREALLERPPRAAEAHPDPEAEGAVTRAEVEALRGLDIPYLLCVSDSDALLAPNGRVVREGFFHGSALERVLQRVRALDAFPLARHEALLCSTLACGHRAPKWGGPSRTVARTGSPDWLAEAVAVGDRVLEEAFRGEGGWCWVGLVHEPLYGLRRLAVLPPDLLAGTAGLAVVLAELHAASGAARFREAAVGALEATRRAVERAGPSTWDAEPLEVGAFRGVGAWLYALHRCAVTLGLPELEAMARDFAASLPLERIGARTSLDVVTGAPGLLLALLACGLTSAARTLSEALGPRLHASPAPPPLPGVLLESLPDPASGWALCAARLREAGVSVPWPESLPPPPPCSGALLARLALGEDAGLPARLLRRREETPGSASERLEALEVALLEPRWRRHAERLGREWVAERHTRGHWFPDRLEADEHDLSAIWGVGAVAHALLRLHQPGRWPSLRLLGGVARYRS